MSLWRSIFRQTSPSIRLNLVGSSCCISISEFLCPSPVLFSAGMCYQYLAFCSIVGYVLSFLFWFCESLACSTVQICLFQMEILLQFLLIHWSLLLHLPFLMYRLPLDCPSAESHPASPMSSLFFLSVFPLHLIVFLCLSQHLLSLCHDCKCCLMLLHLDLIIFFQLT